VSLASWFDLQSGHSCPLCAPRPRINEFVYFCDQLSVSTLYLSRDQTYRGTCAMVYDPAHVTPRPSELSPAEWQRFTSDARVAELLRSQKPTDTGTAMTSNPSGATTTSTSLKANEQSRLDS